MNIVWIWSDGLTNRSELAALEAQKPEIPSLLEFWPSLASMITFQYLKNLMAGYIAVRLKTTKIIFKIFGFNWV